MNVKDWLDKSEKELDSANIDTAHLDSLMMLERVTGMPRVSLLAHPEFELDEQSMNQLTSMVSERKEQLPMAYILGSKEFYGRSFIVNEHVLIPRPESEEIVTVAKQLPNIQTVLDLGTGCGILGITLALENPKLKVTATDCDQDCLEVAQNNSSTLGSPEINFVLSDMFENVQGKFDLIIANLPYGTKKMWAHRMNTLKHEPQRALFADDDSGLSLIENLVTRSPEFLNPGGFVILEHEPVQKDRIDSIAQAHGFSVESASDFVIKLTLKDISPLDTKVQKADDSDDMDNSRVKGDEFVNSESTDGHSENIQSSEDLSDPIG